MFVRGPSMVSRAPNRCRRQDSPQMTADLDFTGFFWKDAEGAPASRKREVPASRAFYKLAVSSPPQKVLLPVRFSANGVALYGVTQSASVIWNY